MSAENEQLVRAAFDALNREGMEAILPYIAPDFEVTIPPSMSIEPDTYRGPEGIRRYFEGFGGAMEFVRFAVDEVVDAGDCVLVSARMVARGAETELEVEMASFQVWKVRAGLAVSLEVFPSREQALRAAGLAGPA